MICRVVLHEKTPGNIVSDEARGFRAWMKGQPGFVSGYHVQDSATGRMLSIAVWESEESVAALEKLTPPGGPVGLARDRVEMFDVVEEF